MRAERWARWEEHLRPGLVRLPGTWAVGLYSRGRRSFLQRFLAETPPAVEPPAPLSRTLWGLRFRAPLGNAAGLFKQGEGYPLAAGQGAGWYLAGTSTGLPRTGNRRHGVRWPFVPYPRSGAASNWLGLPNEGHRALAARLALVARTPGCPIGASLARVGDEPLATLLEGLGAYRDAGVDFLEINESCPNTGEASPAWDELRQRLEAVATGFLARRERPLPVVVKFSNDTATNDVPTLLDTLLELGFDGVNFGNTSTAYARHEDAIDPAEQRLYRHFTTTFGGGLSGRPLAADSLRLLTAARSHLATKPPGREFHLIRTGGVETAADVAASLAAGASLVQWYTGYFAAFAVHGHGVYRWVFEGLPGELTSRTDSDR
ncbi:MAG: hypothetical protein SF066_01485 [Thermoanaerobaculia bacterium]|nr:hypothetical protein [Thermoanaerobaculia bacterium]